MVDVLQEQKDIKIRAFEYSLVLLIKWHLEAENKTVKEFNTNNDYSLKKISLLPYFFVVANGTRKEMSNIFDDFYSEDFGIVSKAVYEYIEKEKSQIFTFPKEDNNTLTINKDSESLFEASLESLRKEIKFSEDDSILEQSEKIKNIHKLLEHSINQYKNNSWLLYQFEEMDLILYSKKTVSWVVGDESTPIDRSWILEEMSPFTENINDRMGLF